MRDVAWRNASPRPRVQSPVCVGSSGAGWSPGHHSSGTWEICVAGLSLPAASGFHLSVLLGATLSIGRCAGRVARLVMAALTLVGFV